MTSCCHNVTVACVLKSFKEIARYLGKALEEREDLHHDVMLALRKLAQQAATDGEH